MYVIDTGRENFFSDDPSTLKNGFAKLLVLDIETKEVKYLHTFANDIFPTNSSFLNDIVVDEARNVAYMSDTNIAGLGAVVRHDLGTGQSLRFAGPSTLAEPWYHTTVLNVTYGFNSPADGIALSSDGSRLFYSVIEGANLFALDAEVFRDGAATQEQVQATVQNVTRKASFSDGLRVLPAAAANGSVVDRLAYGSIGECAVRVLDMARGGGGRAGDLVLRDRVLQRDDDALQWADTFAFVPTGALAGDLWFTTNRLQRYFVRNWDPSGGEGANMRIFNVPYDGTAGAGED